MRWFRVIIDPDGYRPRPAFFAGYSYRLCLPLTGNGRLATAHVRLAPERTEVVRCGGGEERGGHLVLVDHQWTLTWPEASRHDFPDLRLFGARFLAGDTIGLRSQHRPIQLFTVSLSEPVDPFVAARGYSLA